MTKSEADEFVINWWIATDKVFKYRREFMPDEYVVIYKKNSDEYTPDVKASTHKLEVMDREKMTNMIQKAELIYHSDRRFGTDCQHLKTGGCDCGQWLKPHLWGHSDWCDLVKKGIIKK